MGLLAILGLLFMFLMIGLVLPSWGIMKGIDYAVEKNRQNRFARYRRGEEEAAKAAAEAEAAAE